MDEKLAEEDNLVINCLNLRCRHALELHLPDPDDPRALFGYECQAAGCGCEEFA